MSSEFSIEYLGVLEGHGGAVTSLVCGEDKMEHHYYSQDQEINQLSNGN